MSAKAAKNTPGRGFVHTVQATDGSQAQVYLTKNGEHAGIVFRDQIYHGKYIISIQYIKFEKTEKETPADLTICQGNLGLWGTFS